MVVISVSEGDDTVEKHPLIFKDADLVVINKVDIAEAVGADQDKMVSDVKELNPDVKVIKSSLKTGQGLDEIIKSIEGFMDN
jgi:hydrogenase nickel incorporation protein HypB